LAHAAYFRQEILNKFFVYVQEINRQKVEKDIY
jgi:hypothetical protein